MQLTDGQKRGIREEFNSGELSEDQEIELLQKLVDSERERQGITPVTGTNDDR